MTKHGGGFNEVPLVTNKRGRLSIHFWVGGKGAPEQFGDPTACTAVFAYVVPDGTMKHDILLGRDSWELFLIRQERDVSDAETIVTFVGEKGVGWASDRDWGLGWQSNWDGGSRRGRESGGKVGWQEALVAECHVVGEGTTYE